MQRRAINLLAVASLPLWETVGVDATAESDKSFLNNTNNPTVTTLPHNRGSDILYVAPNAVSRLVKYHAFIVDLPKVRMSAQSKFKDAKPIDLDAMSAFLRQAVIDTIAVCGF